MTVPGYYILDGKIGVDYLSTTYAILVERRNHYPIPKFIFSKRYSRRQRKLMRSKFLNKRGNYNGSY